MHGIDVDHKHFAALNGKVIVGYYIDILHDMESLTLPYIEISEELWVALNENSIRNEFINESDIVYDKIYTINDLDLFQEVESIDVDFGKTPVELAIEDLQDSKADKSYVDDAIAQRVTAQIITWEDDD